MLTKRCAHMWHLLPTPKVPEGAAAAGISPLSQQNLLLLQAPSAAYGKLPNLFQLRQVGPA